MRMAKLMKNINVIVNIKLNGNRILNIWILGNRLRIIERQCVKIYSNFDF